jgi:hypothetical protein
MTLITRRIAGSQNQQCQSTLVSHPVVRDEFRDIWRGYAVSRDAELSREGHYQFRDEKQAIFGVPFSTRRELGSGAYAVGQRGLNKENSVAPGKTLTHGF